jgi:hypothetical protein
VQTPPSKPTTSCVAFEPKAARRSSFSLPRPEVWVVSAGRKAIPDDGRAKGTDAPSVLMLVRSVSPKMPRKPSKVDRFN